MVERRTHIQTTTSYVHSLSNTSECTRAVAPEDLAYGMQLKLQHKLGHGPPAALTQIPLGGSKQHQVTGFDGDDDNVWWVIKAAHGAAEPAAGTRVSHADGDVIRLQHSQTGRNLHSHGITSPVTKRWYT